MLEHPQDCPRCGREMDTATVSGGGYVAWFCHECEVLVPGGDYITVIRLDK